MKIIKNNILINIFQTIYKLKAPVPKKKKKKEKKKQFTENQRTHAWPAFRRQSSMKSPCGILWKDVLEPLTHVCTDHNNNNNNNNQNKTKN